MNDNNILKNNFNAWKNWTFEHKKTPKRHSKNKEEDGLSARMSYTLARFKKNPVLYSEYIAEYTRIYEIFNKKAAYKLSPKQIVEQWKAWVEKEHRLPSSTSLDNEERRIAKKMQNHIHNIKLNYEEHEKEICEYQSILSTYRYNTRYEKVKEQFLNWKEWCKKHKRLPKIKTEDLDEKKVKISICNAIAFMKKNPETFANELEEYKQILQQFKREIKKEELNEFFKKLSSWVISHNRLPKSNSEAEEEQKMATKMIRILYLIKGNPDKYSFCANKYLDIYYTFCPKARYSSNLYKVF